MEGVRGIGFVREVPMGMGILVRVILIARDFACTLAMDEDGADMSRLKSRQRRMGVLKEDLLFD